MVPAVGVSCSRISFEVVVLPHPDSPISPRVSPAATAKSTPSTALTRPILRRGKGAVLTAKCLARPATSSRDDIAFLRFLRRQPAARPPGRGQPGLGRRLAGGARQRLGAARVEGAAARQMRQVGRLPGDREQLFLAAE